MTVDYLEYPTDTWKMPVRPVSYSVVKELGASAPAGRRAGRRPVAVDANNGGDERTRTADLLLARQALSL